jgi:hypothetical protein
MWRRIICCLGKTNYKQARQCTYKGIELPTNNHFCCAKARSTPYSEFVSVAFVLQYAQRIRRSILSVVFQAVPYSFHIIS